ncbi:MAG: 50S ribosomal protein L4 [Nitrospirae bacterium]|nr:50S ribosomal protein L4 [Nitrospirota bacterium]
MPQVDLLNKDNKAVNKVDLPDDIFGVEVRKDLLHDVVRNYLANRRQGTASTRTRGEVSGGGKKPYRQKGTGRARAGSNRSPVWRGGGTVFGPKPRDYSYRLPKKVKWGALSSALSSKTASGQIFVIDNLTVSGPKTKELYSVLKGLGLDMSVLIITPEKDSALELSARNIPNVDIARVNELNVYSILNHEKVLILKKSVDLMKEIYLDEQ